MGRHRGQKAQRRRVFAGPVLGGKKGQDAGVREQGANIPGQLHVGVQINAPMLREGMETDVIGGKGKLTLPYHLGHKRVPHGAIGLVPPADFPPGKMSLPAGQAPFTQRR